jgi:hypothetical protein
MHRNYVDWVSILYELENVINFKYFWLQKITNRSNERIKKSETDKCVRLTFFYIFYFVRNKTFNMLTVFVNSKIDLFGKLELFINNQRYRVDLVFLFEVFVLNILLGKQNQIKSIEKKNREIFKCAFF